jgi:hypothetical protein
MKYLQDFIKQRELQSGQENAFKELSPFMQPSLASGTRGKMPTQQEFVTDASQWAQGQGIDPRFAIPAIEQMQGLKQFQTQPKREYREVNGVLGTLDDSGFAPVPGAPTPAPKPPEFDIKENANGDLVYVPRAPGGQLVPVGMKGKPPAPAVSVTVDNGKRQSEVVNSFLKEVPKLYEETLSNRAGYDRIGRALELVKKGGDSITGMSGQIKSALAPMATAIGMNTESMNDAQILQTILDTNAGSLRMEVVGPGPVSEFEQKILQNVSVKKISAAEGVKQILEGHLKEKRKRIDSFNSRLKSASKVPGYEDTLNLYPTIDTDNGEAQAPVSGAKQAQDGNWYIEKDGKFYRVEG